MTVASISRALSWLADQQPDAPAVRDDHRALTRRALDEESNRLARAYADLGVGRDDLVSVALPNGVDFYLACVATWKLGATPNPLPPALPLPERRALVELADPALVVGLDPREHADRTVMQHNPPAEDRSSEPLPDAAASCWKASASGGSTGRPKLVLATAPATVDPETAPAPFVPRHATQLVCGPVHHSTAFTYSVRGLMSGHALVVLPRFDARRVLTAITEHRVSWLPLVPTMMQRIWREPGRAGADVSSLESVLHLGAPCPEWLKRAWLDWLGPERVVELYASTESTGLALISGTDWLAHPGSVGRGVGGSEFSVRDEDGTPVPGGTVGEVWMRRDGGPRYAYRGAEARSAGGWETLGDVGWLEPGGWLHLIDRSADVVLTGGATVWPAEVEAALDEHPAVRSSAVIGLPDDDLGEHLHAIVDTAGAAVAGDELRAWVAGRLEAEKVPRTYEVVDRPLRDDAGKVRRQRLRAERSNRDNAR